MPHRSSAPMTISPAEKDTSAVKHLDRLFSTGTSHPKLVGSNGEEIFLPESVYRALRQVVSAMAEGRAISLVPQDRQMSTQESADFLNVSRPYLIKLLEQGEIPYTLVGKHRRINSKDLMVYKEKRDSQRREDLSNLTEFLQDEGFYDYDVEDDTDCAP